MEKRYFEGTVQIEQRADGHESRTISGYAIVFNKWSHNFNGFFREKVDPKAVEGVLDQDTVALFNHDSNMILARNKKNLSLSVDDFGLKYTFEAPNTTIGNDLLENVRLGNITGSSFSFTIKDQEWRKSEITEVDEDRIILKIETLYDVAPVTFPAYPDTTVDIARRDFEEFIKDHPRENTEQHQTPDVHERELLREVINIKKKS
jgi:uncharacterized protein